MTQQAREAIKEKFYQKFTPNSIYPVEVWDFIDSIISTVEKETREEIKEKIMPKIQKFIDKVESGRARSVETYADMKEVKSILTQP